jgi:hypothetical protein
LGNDKKQAGVMNITISAEDFRQFNERCTQHHRQRIEFVYQCLRKAVEVFAERPMISRGPNFELVNKELEAWDKENPAPNLKDLL